MAIASDLGPFPLESVPTRDAVLEIADFYELSEDEKDDLLEVFWEMKRIRGLQ